MKRGTRRQIAIGITVAVMGAMMWAAAAEAFWPFFRAKHKLRECRADLTTCEGDLGTCETDLAACEANTQTYPGDGYPNPDTHGVSGHGPALSYTDNGDLTATDSNTGFMWELKLPASDTECTGGTPSVHCVDNLYTWSVTLPDADGTVFEEFLWTLNNTCALDETVDCEAGGDATCQGGPGGECGFAGYRDWEIPNIKVLQSIVDYSEFNPANDPSFPGVTAASVYWSATTAAFNSGFAWFVDFLDGGVDFDVKVFDLRVRGVRTGP